MKEHGIWEELKKYMQGAQHRARNRSLRSKSVWNLLLSPLVILLPIFAYALLFSFLWGIWKFMHPSSSMGIYTLWLDALRSNQLAAGFILIPIGFPSIGFGYLLCNFIVWMIPPARKAQESEAGTRKEENYLNSQRGLLWFSGVLLIITLPLGIIAVLNFH
jgi:hypothetical protein